MINTYQTSLAPPPVPPRYNRSQSILIPAPLPSRGHSKPLIRFLVGVVVVHLFLSVAAFIYLYLKHQTGHSEGKGQMTGLDSSQSSSLLSEKRETSSKALAHMLIAAPSTERKTSSGHLEWDMKHSAMKNINIHKKSWLTIQQPGEYYVYSRVTFSMGDPMHPLVSMVKLRNDKNGEENDAMKTSCYLNSNNSKIPNMCTATQGQLITLKNGNQLSVWVHNLSLVDYVDTATTFGMYKVQDS